MGNFTLIVAVGFIIGFLIGMTGMGGGAITTPFLLLVMKIDPILAVGTDLTFAAITKIIGGIQHRREENAPLSKVFWMALGSLPASFVSSQFILQRTEDRQLIESTLPRMIGVVLLVVGVVILARILRLLGPKDYVELKWPPHWALVAIGAFGGLLVGLTSIGGGTVIMALLLVFFSIPLNLMVGMDVIHGAMLATIPALSYIWAGQVDWRLAGSLLIGSIPGAWLGAWAVKRVNRRMVRGMLAFLILGVGLRLVIR